MTRAYVGDALLSRWLHANYMSLTSCRVAEVGGVTTTGYAFPLPVADKDGEAT